MDKRTVIAFNKAFAAEPTEQEKQLVNEMLTIWGKFEMTAGKSPAIYRKGILFGMALQQAIAAGEIILPEVKAKRKAKTTTEQQEPEGTTSE